MKGTEATVKICARGPLLKRHGWIPIPLWTPYPHVGIPDVDVCCCGLVRRVMGGFFLYLLPRQNPTRVDSWDTRAPGCTYDHPDIQFHAAVDDEVFAP